MTPAGWEGDCWAWARSRGVNVLLWPVFHLIVSGLGGWVKAGGVYFFSPRFKIKPILE